MKIKISKTLVFSIVTVVLTTYVYVFEYKKSLQNEADEQSKILKFNADQINYFQIIKADLKIALQKTETGWKLQEPIYEEADNERIQDLLSNLANERQIAKVKLTDSVFNETELSEYGLDKPILTLIIKNNSGITQKISVGSLKNFEGQSYLQLDDGNKIILASAVWFNRSQENLIYYRDKRLFRESVANINRLKITSLRESFELVRDNGKWSSAKYRYDLDQNRIREIIKKVADSSIEEYTFEGEPSQTLLKELSVDKAPVSIELFTDNSSWLAKMNIRTEDNSLYLLSDRPTYLAKVTPLMWETLGTLTLDGLRDRASAFLFNAEEVKKIYFKSNDRETNLIFNSGTWLMGSTNSPYLEVDKSEISKTIKKIHDLKISEFIDTDVREKFVGHNMLILKSDSEKLLLQLNWGPSYKVKRNGVDIDYFYARSHLSDKIFALDKTLIENLNLESERIIKKNEKSSAQINLEPPNSAEK